jgi:hypothetical protein
MIPSLSFPAKHTLAQYLRGTILAWHNTQMSSYDYENTV